jgi:serine/threonine-protein kinase
VRQGEQLGSYTVLEDLGAGGMGKVFLARDEVTGKKVALKVLQASYLADTSLVPRFLREAETYKRLQHPNIVRFIDSGMRDSTYFIALEHVPGESLAQVLKKAAGPLGIRQILFLCLDLLRALQHAHKHEVIHRDLKPENIIISPEGSAKLLDFGVAKSQDQLFHSTGGGLLGTFQYSSPEQSMGRQVDARADIFSFGILLWEMLTGQRAFAGGLLEVVRQQKAEALRSPSTLVPQVPPAFDAICRRLLRYAPEDRFQKISEVLEEFEDFREMARLY